jgi:peptidoglycan/xylan/chitin deacetylase (PgdA/CDA1 family)
MKQKGFFIVSLDFELMWGMRDKKTIASYGENVQGVHRAIPAMLDLFKRFNISITFSTVGFLFMRNKQDLLNHIPKVLPEYQDENLSPYGDYLNQIGSDNSNDPYHFGNELVDMIRKHPQHEIGTHTFSHYYCLEPGQTLEAFRADLEMAIQVGKENGVNIQSLVFPRNQFNRDYLEVCEKLGIICYRGNETSWIYEAKNGKDDRLWRRLFRLLDAYIPISGHNIHDPIECAKQKPINIPSSRFLRPYSSKLRWLDKLRLWRINHSMTAAAKQGKIYHLWWHPHNFGKNLEENLSFLTAILEHQKHLQKKYGFISINMSKFANLISSASK